MIVTPRNRDDSKSRIESIAIIATVSQSAEATLRFCNYHLELGVDHIFLYLDSMDEKGIAYLTEDKRITCIICDADYWAHRKIQRSLILIERNIQNNMDGIRRCREMGIDVVAPIDGDELLYSSNDFKGALLRAFNAVDAVRVFPYEAVHDRKSIRAEVFEGTYFKVLPNRLNKHIVPLFYRRFHKFTDDGFYGHTAGKTIFRADVEITGFENTHSPVFANPVKTGKTNFLKLLHFECMTKNEWVEKWDKRISGLAIPTMRPRRESQYLAIAKAIELGCQQVDRLYRDLYLYSGSAILLGRILGLIQRIKLRVVDAGVKK